MENGKYASHSFKMGSLIGGIIFLYYILMSFIGNPFITIHLFIYMVLLTIGMIFCFTRYRQAQSDVNVKYGRYMAMGTIISLIVALFMTLFFAIYIIKINPAYIQQSIDESVKILENNGMEQYAEIYQKDEMFKMLQVSSILGWFIKEFVVNIILSLLVSFVIYKVTPKAR
jgi:uncharacterized membrane-anchored protein YitT (DUF2179 family)